MKIIDLVGKKFGMLTVVEHIPAKRTETKVRGRWKCVCECGREVIKLTDHLRSTKARKQPGVDGCLQCAPRTPKRISPAGASGFRLLLGTYRASARDAGRVFTLSDDQFRALTKQNCHYCNRVPSQVRTTTAKIYKHGDYTYNGVDRKDNTQGYTPDNSLPCCSVCNIMKKDMGYDEFLSLITAIYQNRSA